MTIDYRVDENLVLSLQKKFISSGGITAPQCFVRVPGTVQAIQLCLMRYIENVTAALGCATAENVQPLSYVNGWTEISDEEIPRVLEKVYGPRPLGEKKIDLLMHIADSLICEIYQRDPTEARGIFVSPARGDWTPAVRRCEHPMEYEVFDAEARSQTTKI